MRIRQFDVLRAIAVLLVLGSHLTWNPLWSRFGWTGVDLFFCLSGFLVSGLLFRDYKTSGEIQWKRFLIRRGFKIYPAYYVFLFLGTAVFSWLAGVPLSWPNLWQDTFFLQDYFVGTWGHLWSLAIEEQFYLVLPALLWLLTLLSRTKKSGLDLPPQADPFRTLPWLCGSIAVACLAMRAARLHDLPAFNHYSHMRPFHLRCDALAFGVLLSYLHEFRRESIMPVFVSGPGRFVLVLSLFCLLPAMLFEQQRPFFYVLGLTLVYLGYGGVLFYSLYCCTGNGWFARALAWIGQSSYSIYLWHLPVASLSVTVLQDRWHWGRNPVFGAYLVASVVIGAGMARAVENPVLRLRERFYPAGGASLERRATSIARVGVPSAV